MGSNPSAVQWMDIWTFFTLICCKNCIVGLKRPQINEKEAGVGPFFKKVAELRTRLALFSRVCANVNHCAQVIYLSPILSYRHRDLIDQERHPKNCFSQILTLKLSVILFRTKMKVLLIALITISSILHSTYGKLPFDTNQRSQLNIVRECLAFAARFMFSCAKMFIYNKILLFFPS